MADYHVRRGLAGIYAGTLKKKGEEWQSRANNMKQYVKVIAT